MTKVMVVEDEPGIRDLLVVALEDEGYSVVAAENGLRALELLAPERPDLILLDLMMPGMDGYELLQCLSQRPDLKNVPVIIMSAGGRPKTNSPPVLAFIRKPFDLGELLNTISGALSRQPTR